MCPMATAKKPEDEVHPWRETRDLHPRDQTLRAHGFEILWRPKNGRDVWIKDGKEYTAEQAMDVVFDLLRSKGS